jgi:hypothetical protein
MQLFRAGPGVVFVEESVERRIGASHSSKSEEPSVAAIAADSWIGRAGVRARAGWRRSLDRDRGVRERKAST